MLMMEGRRFLAAGMRKTHQQKQVSVQVLRTCSGYVVAGGTDGFIGSYPDREAASNPATNTLAKHFSSHHPAPGTFPVVAPIYCAGNYGLFMPGCISYRAPAQPGREIFSGGEVFQRLTDVYNQLDHPRTTSSYPEESTKEKIILDLVVDGEQK